MVKRRKILSLCLALALSGCAKKDLQGGKLANNHIWSETVIGVVGGSLLATEDSMALAQLKTPTEKFFDIFRYMVTPVPTAVAARATMPECPTHTSCVQAWDAQPNGPMWQIDQKNCDYPSVLFSGVWNSIFRHEFADNAECELIRADGFTSGIRDYLEGRAITRTYGEGQNGNQQDVWRLGQNNEAVVAYTDFPSGLADPTLGVQAQGGMTTTFVSSNVRHLSIEGIHLKGYQPRKGTSFYVGESVDWYSIGPANPSAVLIWDKTIHTPGSDIVAVGYGAERQVTQLEVYTQFNIPLSVGVTTLVDNQPLRWSIAQCCWPSSGGIHTEFTRTGEGFGPKWRSERLVFTGGCGQAEYTTYIGPNATGQRRSYSVQLNQCH